MNAKTVRDFHDVNLIVRVHAVFLVYNKTPLVSKKTQLVDLAPKVCLGLCCYLYIRELDTAKARFLFLIPRRN